MSRTVVIIDDDADDLDVMKSSLAEVDKSIECVLFERPEAAIEQFAKGRLPAPDFIFMDLNMPGLKGETALLKLRSIDKLRDTAIVMLSTSMSQIKGSNLIRDGATYTFQKPWHLREYQRILTEILSGNVKGPRHIASNDL